MRSKTRSGARKKLTLDAAAAVAPNLTFSVGQLVLEAAGGDDEYLREFDLTANNGGFTHLPGFDYPVVFDLKTIWRGPEEIPLLLDHDFRRPVGHTTGVKISERDITGRGITSVPGPDREKVVDAADNEFVWQLSVGGTADADDIFFIEEGQTLEVNGRALHGPFFYVINYHLREISFVALGADNEGATATLVAALVNKGLATMNFAQWLAKNGVDINGLSGDELVAQRTKYDLWVKQTGGGDTAAAADGTQTQDTGAGGGDTDGAASAGTQADDSAASATSTTPAAPTPASAETGGTVAGTTDESTYLADRAEQVQQAHTLETLNAQYDNPSLRVDAQGRPSIDGQREVSLLAHAMTNNWSRENYELWAERMTRPAPVDRTAAGGVGNTTVDLNAALVGGLLLRAGVNLETEVGSTGQGRRYLNASFRQGVNDEGRQRWMNEASRYQHFSLAEMVQACAVANGVDLNASYGHFRGNPQWIRAAFSMHEIADMFTQSITAVLLDSYEQENNTLFPMVHRQPVLNFLLQERKRMKISGNDFEKHHPTQTASDMQLSSTGEEYKIARFSKMLTVNEETLINEAFDVIRDQPRAMGEAAARLEPEQILALILNNPNMKDGAAWLSAGAGNLRTSSAFSTATLKTGYTAFSLLQEDGVTLNLRPDGILHSLTDTWTVLETLADAGLITGNTTTQTSKNVVANLVRPVSDARLDNGFNDPDDRTSAITGEPGSWVLFNERYPAIELGHLAGTDGMLQIDSGNLTQGQWGIWFAGKKDSGAAPLRRESIQKNEA